MEQLRTFKCQACGQPGSTSIATKRYCDKRCQDRGRYVRPGEVQNGLRMFSRLSQEDRNSILLGEQGFSVVMYDIEATHLKGNIGRILCTSFKPLGAEPYTFSGLERRFKMADNYDDSLLAEATRDELEKFDIIVGWNSKEFDTKFINARNIRVGQRTKKPQYQVDAMWSWRSKAAAWSGLDSVDKFVNPGGEKKTSVDWQKWMQATGWNAELRKAAMASITEHCEIDVRVLESVYRLQVATNQIRSLKRDGGL